MTTKTKKVLYYFALFMAGGSFLISLIALVALFFGEYGFWKWLNVISNTVFFGFVAWYFYFKKIKNDN